MVMLRATKSLKYGTRRLMAGDEFEARPRDARILRAIRKAEDVPDEQPSARRRGRPPKAAPATEPEEEYRTRAELLEVAEERGIDLPAGYVSKDELVDLVGQSDGDPDESSDR